MSLCSSLVPKPHPALAHLFETRTCILVQILVELHNEEECCHLMLLCPSLHHKLPALLWLQSDHLRQPCIESNGNKDPLINCMQEAYSHFLNLLKIIYSYETRCEKHSLISTFYKWAVIFWFWKSSFHKKSEIYPGVFSYNVIYFLR